MQPVSTGNRQKRAVFTLFGAGVSAARSVLRRRYTKVFPEVVCKIALGAELKSVADGLNVVLGGSQKQSGPLQPLGADIGDGGNAHFLPEFFC